MSIQLADRVRAVSESTGTGDITLGATPDGFVAFSAAYNDGARLYYTIANTDANEWEVGLGEYDAGVLKRHRVFKSSNNGAKVSFTAGVKDIFVTAPAVFLTQVALAHGDGLLDSPKPAFHQVFDKNDEPLDPRFTFSRSTPAWYWKNGVLVEAGIDEPVFEDGALRLEPQATNIAFEDDLTEWGRVDGASVEVGEYVGGIQLYKVIAAEGRTQGRINSNTFSVEQSTRYTLTVLIARGTESVVTIQGQNYQSAPPYNSTAPRHDVNLDTLSVSGGGSVEHLGGRFYIFTVTYLTNEGDGSYSVYVQLNPGYRGTDYEGGEFTEFGCITYTKDAVPVGLVNGSSTTRAADNLSLTGEAFQRVFNPNEGAIVWRGSLHESENQNSWFVGFGRPSGGGYFGLQYKPFSRELSVGSSVLGNMDDIYNFEFGEDICAALSWHSGGFKVFVNGSLVGERQGAFALPGYYRLYLNTLNGGSRYRSNVRVKSFQAFTTRPTDAEMEALTNA